MSKKEKNPRHFLIDEAEPKWLRKLFQLEGVKPVGEAAPGQDTYEVCTLSEGDIVCEEVSLAVERKTEDDLWQSVKDGRVGRQTLRMIEKYEISAIWVTGSLRKLEDYVNPATGLSAIRPTLGMMASLIARFVKVDEENKVVRRPQFFTGLTSKQLVVLAIGLAHKLGKKPVTAVRVRPHGKSLEDAPLNIMMGVPGLGPKVAKIVLKKMGTAQAVANATEEQLKSIGGVKEVRASMVYDSFRQKYEPEDE